MFSAEVRKLLLEVISSWQVITVTIILILYVFIVNSVARLYSRRSRRSFFPAMPSSSKEESPLAADDEAEELDLEEEAPAPQNDKKKG
ncbi:MAG: hypothetical protein FWH35_05885 [Treponema sp.]|nr:hypothetical protein [Treponema sp.]